MQFGSVGAVDGPCQRKCQSVPDGIVRRVARRRGKAEYLGNKLENLAEGAFGLFNAVTGLVSSSIDGFIAGAVSGSFAGGAAVAGGPPGWVAGLVGGGYAGWRVANAVQEAAQAYQKYGEIKSFVETSAAGFELVRSGMLQLPGENMPEIPDQRDWSSFTPPRSA